MSCLLSANDRAISGGDVFLFIPRSHWLADKHSEMFIARPFNFLYYLARRFKNRKNVRNGSKSWQIRYFCNCKNCSVSAIFSCRSFIIQNPWQQAKDMSFWYSWCFCVSLLIVKLDQGPPKMITTYDYS